MSAGAYRTDRVAYVNGFGGDTSIPTVSAPPTSVIVPGSVGAVPASTLTEIVAYTNGATVLFLDGWSGTGQYDGDWYLEINGTPVHEGNALNVAQAGRNYTTPIRIEAGILVRIMVTHYGTATGKFDGSLFGHRNG